MNQTTDHRWGQRGMVLVLVLVVIVPVFVLATSAITVTNHRSSTTLETRDQELALNAAESGIDVVIHQARTGALQVGTPFVGLIGADLRFEALATDLAADGEDNDGDAQIDEVDEQIYRVEVTGIYRNDRRRLISHVARIDPLPGIEGAVSLMNGTAQVVINGASFWIRGTDTTMEGNPGGGTPLPGIRIADPGTPDSVTRLLGKQQQGRIDGIGGAPSVQPGGDPLSFTSKIEELRPFAHNIWPGGAYREVDDFGQVDGLWRITFFDGDTKLGGKLSGAGVLIVNGDLATKGTLEFTGLVIVKGNLTLSGGGSGTMIRGGVITGGDLTINGSVDIEYSQQVAEKLKNIAARRVLRGWREIARQ